MSVRTRYAPSPTGLQHVGGVRTALFNYFFARSQGGQFILRVEDTDQARYSEEAMEDLISTLEWLGIQWDEGPEKEGDCGPYVQSQRVDLHREHAEKLIGEGNAYYCFCTPERLEKVREQQTKEKQKVIGYDRHCRNLEEAEIDRLLEAGGPKVVRFKVPLQGETTFRDQLLGEISKDNRDINPDPVLLKSDGFPTYHLANVVDDHLMGITHVMRAQEWIPSGSLHAQLYQAFGWDPPLFCHLPMVMGKDGQKLSKRHGSTSIREFREQGYLPEGMINYISLLGWSYDDSREFFTRSELEELFTLEKLNKAPGVFDYQKLQWFNGHYIREKSDEELLSLLLPRLQEAGVVSNPLTEKEQEICSGMIPLVKERLKVLNEAPDLARFLFHEVAGYPAESLIPKTLDGPKTLEILRVDRELVAAMEEHTDEEVEELFRVKAGELEVKLGAMLMPLRVALTGSTVSPPLFESIRLLGITPSIRRIDDAIELLKRT